jgi:hypothetical protein
MAILKPTTPSTTESATNRIDLDDRDPGFLIAVIEQYAALNASVTLSDRQRQHWSACRAELLRLARSPDDACPAAGEES